MTNEERVFERELELFRKECEGAAQFFFGHLAINEMAKRRESVLLALFGWPQRWRRSCTRGSDDSGVNRAVARTSERPAQNRHSDEKQERRSEEAKA